jgi:DNA polymerase zeta
MEQASLRVLINQIDYTVAPPGALDNTSLPRVPVIRIYGASSTGQKACVHVHQVYPYFFVEYGGKLSPSNGMSWWCQPLDIFLISQSVSQYIAKLSRSLNHAIAISMKRNPHSPNSQFVRAVLLVKGIHFYGFHSSYTPFLKILIADPAFVNRAVTILQSGTVMRTRFRVYESHLNYILQFMCDFGLYGCGWINLAAVWQRGHEENDIEMIEQSTFKVSPHFRQSRMPLEVDVAAHQILNRRLLSARNIHHKLAIPAPPLPAEPVVLSVRELWDDERRRRLAQGLAPTPVLPLDSSKMSRDYGGEWVAEARWWEELRKRIEKERDTEPTMTDRTELWEKWVMTTFESVEALWEPEWRTWKPDRGKTNGHTTLAAEAENVENPFAQATQDGVSINQKGPPQSMDVDVDEMLLSTQEMSQMMDRGDEEWADLQEGDTIAEPDDTAVDAQFLEEEPPPDSRTDAHNPCGEVEVSTDGDERFNGLCFFVVALTNACLSVSPSRNHSPSVFQYSSHSRASYVNIFFREPSLR